MEHLQIIEVTECTYIPNTAPCKETKIKDEILCQSEVDQRKINTWPLLSCISTEMGID
jgi:hypothetical protein